MCFNCKIHTNFPKHRIKKIMQAILLIVLILFLCWNDNMLDVLGEIKYEINFTLFILLRIKILCKITYVACIIFLLVSSGVMQCLHAIIRESNFNNLALFKSECQYAFCSRGIWIYTRACAMHLHTHPYSCMWEKSHHLRNERNHPNKSKVVVFTHRNDVFLHLFVLIKPPIPKSTVENKLLEQFILSSPWIRKVVLGTAC